MSRAWGRLRPSGCARGRCFRDCDVCPEMVVVPPGSYMMGSPASEEGRYDREGPQHPVTIGYAFALGVYEVTFAEWDACAAAGGCEGDGPYDWGWGRGRRPVISVSWEDAQEYLRWLSRETGVEYRLPSESEWEYAARAGTATARHWGESESEQCRYANGHDRRSASVHWDSGFAECDDGYPVTAPVGVYEANTFGLHDMLGNASELTEDCWNENYSGAPSNGSAWLSGDCSQRVSRGGHSGAHPHILRSANRSWYGGMHDGFRVARTITGMSVWANDLEVLSDLAESWRLDWRDLMMNAVTIDAERVTAIDLSHRALTGPIPAALGDLAHLTTLDLSDNLLEGQLPSALGRLTRLAELNLASNRLRGRIPAWLGQLTQLTELNLAHNLWAGDIPPELGQLTRLTTLIIENICTDVGWPGCGGISGMIPVELGQLSELKTLVLSGQRLTGGIPPELLQLTQLTRLDLSGNMTLMTRLTTEIPPGLDRLTRLTNLDLSFNSLSGEIPRELGQLTQLTHLGLSFNHFTGEIPPELGRLTQLKSLGLVQNEGLTGEIPRELGQLDQLRDLVLPQGVCVPEALRHWYLAVAYSRNPSPESYCDSR